MAESQEVVKKGVASNYAIRLAFQAVCRRKMQEGNYVGAATKVVKMLGEEKAKAAWAAFDAPTAKFPVAPGFGRTKTATTPLYVLAWDHADWPIGLGEDENAFLQQREWGTLQVGRAEHLLQNLISLGFTVQTHTRYVTPD